MTGLVVRSRAGESLAELSVSSSGLTITSCTDPTLAAVLQDLLSAPHLPAAVRTPLAGGGHAVGVDRLTPRDPGYVEALVAALSRKGPWRAAAE